jgi:hypothetical protein
VFELEFWENTGDGGEKSRVKVQNVAVDSTPNIARKKSDRLLVQDGQSYISGGRAGADSGPSLGLEKTLA